MEHRGIVGGRCVSYIDDLREVIHKLHGATATHVESVPITESFKGRTIWDGVVEVFDLHGHPGTHRVYAWSHETEDPDSPTRHVTVLHVPPAVSPLMAVRASIASDYYDSQKGKKAGKA
jgi:hypothetical protein